MVKKRGTTRRDLLQLLFWLVIVVLMNYISTFLFGRFDLTSEKRYTLSEATKKLVTELEDVVFVRVYLEGDLPANFQELRDATKEMLDEFRALSPYVEYEFINPSPEDADEKTKLEIYQQLTEKGLQYRNIGKRNIDKVSEKIIFPGAIFAHKGQEIPMDLLQEQLGAPPEVIINNSIQQLEYEISSTIIKLTRPKRQKIAFIQGHGELNAIEVADISKSLGEFYTIQGVEIDGKLDALNDIDAIIVAKPDSMFSDKDKFIIDQFIMQGGRSIWLLDMVHATMDSLRNQNTAMALPFDLNLTDMLFKYGVRLNKNLILDLRAIRIPIVTDELGQQRFFPWFYFPLLVANSKHPIISNVDVVKTEFVNSLDTVSAKGIKKTVLFTSSDYTKLANAPTRISLGMLRQAPDERQYNKGPQIIALLMEGKFQSVFENRLPPQISENRDIDFKGSGKPAKMIVISDGDIIRNYVNPGGTQFMPLGYDRYTNHTYGNKDFIMNAVNYICDDSGLIEVRAKEFKLRMLDEQRSQKQRAGWQLLNTAVPVLLILLVSVAQYIRRKRVYAK